MIRFLKYDKSGVFLANPRRLQQAGKNRFCGNDDDMRQRRRGCLPRLDQDISKCTLRKTE